MNFKYTDYSTPYLHSTLYCAKVSYHHYWFKSYDDMLTFMDSKYYDSRMTFSNPAKDL